MAPSKEIFEAAVKKLEIIIEKTAGGSSEPDDDGPEDDHESHGSLIQFPHGGSNLEIILFVILFPLKFLMHYTIPDVRVLDHQGLPTATLGKALLSALMCLVWLIIGSYAMVASLEALAGRFAMPAYVHFITQKLTLCISPIGYS